MSSHLSRACFPIFCRMMSDDKCSVGVRACRAWHNSSAKVCSGTSGFTVIRAMVLMFTPPANSCNVILDDSDEAKRKRVVWGGACPFLDETWEGGGGIFVIWKIADVDGKAFVLSNKNVIRTLKPLLMIRPSSLSIGHRLSQQPDDPGKYLRELGLAVGQKPDGQACKLCVAHCDHRMRARCVCEHFNKSNHVPAAVFVHQFAGSVFLCDERSEQNFKV